MSYTRVCWPDHASTNAAGAVVYLLSGAARSFNFIDDEGVAISLECEAGDVVSMDGDLSSSSPCDVSALPIGPNQLRGIFAVSYIVRFEWSAPHTCQSGTDLTSLIPYPRHVPNFVEYGVLGVDVEARQSTIAESGLGLFLLRDYPDGGIVTNTMALFAINPRSLASVTNQQFWGHHTGVAYPTLTLSLRESLQRGGCSRDEVEQVWQTTSQEIERTASSKSFGQNQCFAQGSVKMMAATTPSQESF